MRAPRLVIATVRACVIAVAASGCGSDPSAPTQPAPPPGRQAADARDNAVERQITEMHRAARAGDISAVGRAQRELERLAATDPGPATKSSASDPFTRVVEEFAFKRAPLFVQQISTTESSHRLYAGVDRAAFCLLTPDARQAAVDGALEPIDRRLRAEGISDLQFVVVALTRTAATMDRALAIGRRGSVRLTQRGRACT